MISNPPEAEPRTSSCSGPCLYSFWISPRMKTPQSLWAACTSVQSSSSEKVFPDIEGTSSVSVYSITSGPVINHQRLAPSLGSVQFNTFINSIDTGICVFSASLLMTSSWFVIDIPEGKEAIQGDLDKLDKLACVNPMKLNKCKVLNLASGNPSYQ